MTAPPTVLHLALASDWAVALRRGVYDRSTLGKTIDEVGYLHASRDARQASEVARRFYGAVSEPLLLLEIDTAALPTYGLRVAVEPADPSLPAAGAGELFPHVYGGPLPVAVVRSATPYEVPPAP